MLSHPAEEPVGSMEVINDEGSCLAPLLVSLEAPSYSSSLLGADTSLPFTLPD